MVMMERFRQSGEQNHVGDEKFPDPGAVGATGG